MGSFNKVLLMGNLTRDPETRFTQGGMAVVNFGLAVNEKFQGSDGQNQERTTFVDVTMFGKRGEAFARFHTKGKSAFVEGKLRLDTWEDKNGGGKRSKLYVVGDSWEFVGGGGRDGGGQGGDDGGSWGASRSGGGDRAESGGGGGGWGGPEAETEFTDTPF
ncbi:Single-stranded DNA-binding protein [Planctomycetes bacterium Pla163]|uniref:Single-stranded DNA-binding protein n=1 Tax=Rohdeia mirabilis TaxID=2528008 RepID=A0A518D103_9BACT|nr:Single-stranded DNA-binding protein [Planctomycetes bacterium Pla163]